MMNLIRPEYPKLEYGAREIVINPHETKRSANGRIPANTVVKCLRPFGD